MKTLADLKRAIKPGVRLRCIKNQYRPELDGGIRVVVRVFTGQFTWQKGFRTSPKAPNVSPECGYRQSAALRYFAAASVCD